EENQNLAERILQQGGTLLSPFPLNQVPLPQNFPERNELIAALAAGTVVIEGAEKSGAAITGRLALSMGKTVCALTQDFRSDFGRGAIRLQQEGAVLVTREEEAVEALFRRFGGFAGPLPLAKPIRKNRCFSFKEFQRASGRSVPEALALLEEGLLQGKIVRQGSHYRLS
ncbi:MAG TPA: DNA-processing protein DprA, partial [Bdellovibrionota bacterium]